jgi:hypothetical protein
MEDLYDTLVATTPPHLMAAIDSIYTGDNTTRDIKLHDAAKLFVYWSFAHTLCLLLTLLSATSFVVGLLVWASEEYLVLTFTGTAVMGNVTVVVWWCRHDANMAMKACE